jgi:tight adherence protein B
MALIAIIIFIGVFAVAAPFAIGRGTDRKGPAPGTLEFRTVDGKKDPHDPTHGLRKSTLLSAIPIMHRMLMKFELAPYLRMLLYQSNVKWTVGGLLLSCASLFLVSGYLVWLRSQSILFAVVFGLAVAAAPFGYVHMKRGQRFKKFEEGLPEALDLMVSALRVGQSLNSALNLVSRECPDPVGTEFRICFDEQNYGLELRGAMINMILRIPVQDLRLVTTAILIQKESGGNLAEVLDKAAHITRERFRLKRQIMTHTAQGRMTGWVLTCLPIGVATVLYFINPTLMSVLWTRPIGIKLLWGAAAGTVIGSLIIRKIIRIDV